MRRHFSEYIGVDEHGHLRIEARDALDLADEFGTPLFVVSESQIRHNVRTITRAFRARYPRTEILFSNKANNNPAEWGDGANERVGDGNEPGQRANEPVDVLTQSVGRGTEPVGHDRTDVGHLVRPVGRLAGEDVLRPLGVRVADARLRLGHAADDGQLVGERRRLGQ